MPTARKGRKPHVHEILEPDGPPRARGPNGSAVPVGDKDANNVYGRVLKRMQRAKVDSPVAVDGEHELANLSDAIANNGVVSPATRRRASEWDSAGQRSMKRLERQSKVFDLKRLGHPIDAIAKVFGINRETVRTDLREEGKRRFDDMLSMDTNGQIALAAARFEDVIQFERAKVGTEKATGHEARNIIAAQRELVNLAGIDPETIAKLERERAMNRQPGDVFDHLKPHEITEFYGVLVRAVGGSGRGEPLSIGPGRDVTPPREPSSGE
jgi:hypothetical protein